MGAPPPPQAPQFSPQTPSQLSPMMRPGGGGATPTQRPPQLSPFGAQTSPAAGANGGAAGQFVQFLLPGLQIHRLPADRWRLGRLNETMLTSACAELDTTPAELRVLLFLSQQPSGAASPFTGSIS